VASCFDRLGKEQDDACCDHLRERCPSSATLASETSIIRDRRSPLFSLAADAIAWHRNVTPAARSSVGRNFLRPELLEVLDCTYDVGWNFFRNLLDRSVARLGDLDAARNDPDVQSTAERLARRFHGQSPSAFYTYLGEHTGIFHKLVIGEMSLAEAYYREEQYCQYGLLTLAHLWRDLLPRLPGQLSLAGAMLGKFGSLDFLSTSAWPLDSFDLLLGEGEQGEKAPRSAQRFLRQAGRAGTAPREDSAPDWMPPVLWRAVDPQGCTCTTRGAWACDSPVMASASRLWGPRYASNILVGVSMGHISLTMDIAAALLKAHGAVSIAMLCGDPRESESRADIHTGSCKKMCSLAARFCELPRISFVKSSSEISRIRREADLLVCFSYDECYDLVSTYGKPFIMYDGTQYGHQLFGRPNPNWHHLQALQRLLAQDVYVLQRRLRLERLLAYEVLGVVGSALGGASSGGVEEREQEEIVRPGGVVFTTNPWQAEALFFLTGVRVPSVRPSNMYLTSRHDPSRGSRDVFLHNDRGRCVVCSVFADVLRSAVVDNFPLRLVHTHDYLEFGEIARFRAVVLVPHGNVMQMFFREAVNMFIPIYIPDRRFLAKQPFLWFFERLKSSLGEEHRHLLTEPPLPPGFDRPHPFSPYVLGHLAGPERFRATLYWMQFLDYFHWPGVRHFASLTDLLHGLVHDNMEAASEKLRHFVVRQRRLTTIFWRDALVRLLVRQERRDENMTG